MDDIDEEVVELINSETRRVGTRSGLNFMITQYEYEGTWKL